MIRSLRECTRAIFIRIIFVPAVPVAIITQGIIKRERSISRRGRLLIAPREQEEADAAPHCNEHRQSHQENRGKTMTAVRGPGADGGAGERSKFLSTCSVGGRFRCTIGVSEGTIAGDRCLIISTSKARRLF